MNFEIKSRWNGDVLFSLECGSLKICIEAAVKQGADLRGADLRGAYLQGADLQGADLRGADLRDADLQGADLRDAYLRDAYLQGAALRGADLRDAYLQGAALRGADLRDAYLQGAALRGADLRGVKNINEATDAKISLAQLRICPQEGAFVGWKKLTGGVIAKLVIPHDAERLNSYGSRKCRASKVFVDELFGDESAFDRHSGAIEYRQGIEVFPDSFDADPTVECSHGIHFFITREEAEAY